MATEKIVIHGAREHNLKNVHLELPRDKLIVFTGISGSGKSSLAFDTIYAEGQRRYVESLSSYARQFLGQMEKPDVDFVEGMSPAISIDQKTASQNPRSTVGTITEIYDYLRLLYARVGKPHCPKCGRPIARQSPDQIVDQVRALAEGTRFQVLAPIVRSRKGEYEKLLEDLGKKGFARARVDGEVRELSEKIRLDRYYKHTIEVIVDRLVMKPGLERRLADSIETALNLADGMVAIELVDTNEIQTYSQHLACHHCGLSFEELQPKNFSFNSPYGACPRCDGLGIHLEVDEELVVPDPDLSVEEAALAPWSTSRTEYFFRMLESVAAFAGVKPKTPWRKLTKKQREVFLYGTGDDQIHVRYKNRYGRTRSYNTYFEGVVPWLERKRDEADSDYHREKIEEYMREIPCPACKGMRLKPESLAVTVGGVNIAELCRMSIAETDKFLRTLEWTDREHLIGDRIIKEVTSRLGFLIDVGLDYLTLERSAATLAGGEAQRIRLATQIGSGLVGVLYILDEPSVGLHQRDNHRLIETLVRLRDIGNTLIVVEHDEATIRTADYIVDIGPGAGEHGGEVVHAGSFKQLLANNKSLTGQYLSRKRSIPVPAWRRPPGGNYLTVKGARQNNLKNIDVKIPLGSLVSITGVSGSGKSSLLTDTLYPALMKRIYGSRSVPGKHRSLTGVEHVDKVVNVDQAPIGRTPRSNPATYIGVFDHVRSLFSQTPEARARGYQPGRFSFNVKGGRCESCAGDGQIKIEMHFLPDIYVPCEVCKGKRYNRETLDVTFKGKNISQVLEMSVEEGVTFFEALPVIRRHLETLNDVGLGYIKLGQPAPTLSGGEAQRVKLASELSKRATGRTVYILDEPTTGLHFEDISKLLGVLQRLVDAGNTVIVIEHNLDVVKQADWLIDLGPEGGNLGGEIVAQGTPEDVARVPRSYTGRFLREELGIQPEADEPVAAG
ncbi:MAG TPA: excinuclease ABC subunit UvrA [Actinomycetota bacterium]|nr:excinuclease ABC subunit UvrA [Actinomycetota bacterium]